ncbi:MAG: tRNA 2-thiouridine(34) synthase MnmA [Clostridium sp.]|jgi:tRNA-specific 2-thiouridylase|uniref:tRNA 2-thiouridine(34) synthase MnmA n=1 Tax=Clostridium sp. TaxID=1506 RepID=UPI0025B90036|nr:tRNA 2-thiouridine(34) synthase MnmA [Clostridium sp.]MCH3963796.1 tRNA 2-thiouridine(34) synthase MnmA [Clostridium sp.]MCI1714937.1 tRNA 2-thiouridine(34) synthase MnmA [Clostridium sp.]MCI1798874.1 tRNA 2-thiouridine(34) synthase MnmA [Clostridium sp.]MCI1813120.1 tRNA 2-thiouridine(34) synthase MnmA [Clostridium sp.]MCI1870010.1 tRNA 2-thiouridine(34) synthase MnmA [Clostridium sp.]
MKKRVVVGMSGGVDSSVAAYLLKKQGYDVIGITMQVWQEDEYYEGMESGCCSLSAVDDARMVAYKLGIPYYVMNFRNEFKKNVIDYFIREYMKGRTPNPCIACNKFLKFDELLKRAAQLGADYVATGHYATVDKMNDRYVLIKSQDDRKDQTYALYSLTQFQLAHTLMPCGEYKKTEIREIARKIGLGVHDKRDSEEICFIPDNDHGSYISRQLNGGIRKGNFVDKEGNILGRHKGIVYYTVGQRKGLGISFGIPMYVIDIDPSQNRIVLGNESDLMKKEFIIKDVNFMLFETLDSNLDVQCKIRYSAKPGEAVISPYGEGLVKVKFKEPQRAITKGQSAVFYQENIMIGGGTIDELL